MTQFVEKHNSAETPIPLFKGFPDALKQYRHHTRWGVWKWYWDNTKWTKIPLQAKAGLPAARSNDPTTWANADDAINAARKFDAGLAIFLRNMQNLVVVDLDNCIDDDGIIAPWANAIVERCNSYTELSPSGRGLHIFGSTSREIDKKVWVEQDGQEIEIFNNCNFYLTVSGDVFGGFDTLADISDDPLLALAEAKANGILPAANIPMPAEAIKQPAEPVQIKIGGVVVYTDETRSEDVVRALNSPAWNPNLYDDWVNAALALKSLPDGKQIWWDWSRRSPKHNDAEAERKWSETVATHGITARSILARIPSNVLSDWGKEHHAGSVSMSGLNKPERHATNAFPLQDNVPADRFQWQDKNTIHEPIINQSWLIKKVMPSNGIGVMFGRPGSGKSAVVLDIALHIAAGMPYRGNRTEAGQVAYISSEGGRIGVNRIFAWMRHNGVNEWPENFRVSPAAFDLSSTEADAVLIADEVARCQPECKLLIIDTLARNFGSGNENASEDMGQFVASVDLIARRLGCFVLIVHHSGKDSAKGSRGHSSLLGAISAEYEVERELGEHVGNIKNSKMRDAPESEPWPFSIQSIKLGVDADNDEVTAGVAIEPDAALVAARPEKLTPTQRKVMQAFDAYLDQHGVTPDAALFSERIKPHVNADAFFEIAVACFSSKEPREARRTAKIKIAELIEAGWLYREGDKVWRGR